MKQKRYTVRYTWAEGETVVLVYAHSEIAARHHANQRLLEPTGDNDEDRENKAILGCPRLQISVELQAD